MTAHVREYEFEIAQSSTTVMNLIEADLLGSHELLRGNIRPSPVAFGHVGPRAKPASQIARSVKEERYEHACYRVSTAGGERVNANPKHARTNTLRFIAVGPTLRVREKRLRRHRRHRRLVRTHPHPHRCRRRRRRHRRP